MSLSRFNEMVTKKTEELSAHRQVPVMQGQLQGTYAFAFLNPPIMDLEVEKGAETEAEIGEQFSSEIRTKVQRSAMKVVGDFMNRASEDPALEDYDRELFDGLFNLPSEVKDSISRSVVVNSRKEKLPGVRGLFESEVFQEDPNPPYSFLPGSISAMTRALAGLAGVRENPKKRVVHTVNAVPDYFGIQVLDLKGADYSIPGGGFGVLVYQGLWGVVLGTLQFVRLWNGTEDFEVADVEMSLTPFDLEFPDLKELKSQLDRDWKLFIDQLTKWRKERANEIASFKNRRVTS